MRLSLVLLTALALTACANGDTEDGERDAAPTTEQSESLSPGTPAPEPTRTLPPPGESAPMDGDVAPGPDGLIPPEVIPFGSSAYRSTAIPDEYEPFQWEPTLIGVDCGAVDPRDLNEEHRIELADPVILEPGYELCSVTVEYENIGSLPGVPSVPEGLIIDDVLDGSSPALAEINRLVMSAALPEPLAPGATVEVESFLAAPEDADISAIYFGPDASMIEAWLLTE